ncbi:MAG TPA: hypothetical protein VNQ53_08340 [Nocardioides sp.]|nr:hypothetical protein [Nocardioides sp.]
MYVYASGAEDRAGREDGDRTRRVRQRAYETGKIDKLILCIPPCLFVAVMGPAAINIMDNLNG